MHRASRGSVVSRSTATGEAGSSSGCASAASPRRLSRRARPGSAVDECGDAGRERGPWCGCADSADPVAGLVRRRRRRRRGLASAASAPPAAPRAGTAERHGRRNPDESVRSSDEHARPRLRGHQRSTSSAGNRASSAAASRPPGRSPCPAATSSSQAPTAAGTHAASAAPHGPSSDQRVPHDRAHRVDPGRGDAGQVGRPAGAVRGDEHRRVVERRRVAVGPPPRLRRRTAEEGVVGRPRRAAGLDEADPRRRSAGVTRTALDAP